MFSSVLSSLFFLALVFVFFLWFPKEKKFSLKSKTEIHNFREYLEGNKYTASFRVVTKNTSLFDAVLLKYVIVIEDGDILKKHPAIGKYNVNKRIGAGKQFEADIDIVLDADPGKTAIIQSPSSKRKIRVFLCSSGNEDDGTVVSEEFQIYPGAEYAGTGKTGLKKDNAADAVSNEPEYPYDHEYDEETEALVKEITNEQMNEKMKKIMKDIIKK